jgi:hypothetical protein
VLSTRCNFHLGFTLGALAGLLDLDLDLLLDSLPRRREPE